MTVMGFVQLVPQESSQEDPLVAALARKAEAEKQRQESLSMGALSISLDGVLMHSVNLCVCSLAASSHSAHGSARKPRKHVGPPATRTTRFGWLRCSLARLALESFGVLRRFY